MAAGVVAWRAGAQLEQLAALGYPGIFLLMMLSGGSMVFPVPGLAGVLAAGALWNPLLAGLAAGLGNATGELTGYVTGRVGAAVVGHREPPRWWPVLRSWLERYGFLAVVAFATVPNPVFDALGLLAGSTGYPVKRFWLACVIGNSLKYTAMAYLGDAAWFRLGNGTG